MRIVALILAAAGCAFSQLPAPISSLTGKVSASVITNDSAGNVYFASFTNNRNLPVTEGALQAGYTPATCISFGFHTGPIEFDCYDVYLAKLDAGGTVILAATYLGGVGNEYPYKLAVANDGSVVLTGVSDNLDFLPRPGGASANFSGFVARISPDFKKLVHAVAAPATSLTLDGAGNAWVAGQPTGTFPQSPVLTRISAADAATTQWTLDDSQSAPVLAAHPAGGVVVVGKRPGGPAAVLRFSAAGKPVHVANFGDASSFPQNAVVSKSGDIFVVGSGAGGFLARVAIDGDVNLLKIGQVLTTLVAGEDGRVFAFGLSSAGLPTTMDAVERCRAVPGMNSVVVGWDGKSEKPWYASYLSSVRFGTGVLMSLDASGALAFLTAPGTPAVKLQPGKDSGRAACMDSLPANLADEPWFQNMDPVTVPVAVAPGEFVVFYGSGIGPAEEVRSDPDRDGSAPRELGGVRLLIGGREASLLSVSENRISAIVPFSTPAAETTAVEVMLGSVRVARTEVRAEDAIPGVFGRLVLNADATVNTTDRRASPGDVIAAFVSGGGALTPAAVDGAIVEAPLPRAVIPVKGFIEGAGGVAVTYAGQAPGTVAGLMQVNVRIGDDFTYHGRMTLYLFFGNRQVDIPFWVK